MKLMSFALFLLACESCTAQEVPYFVTYSHHMEEPGSLEIESKTVTGRPPEGNRFFGNSVEFEYGTTAWWTSEVYVDVAGTKNDSTVLTASGWKTAGGRSGESIGSI